MIDYVKGSVTEPKETGGERVVVHVCNDAGGWGPEGRSVADAIGKKWPGAKYLYRGEFEAAKLGWQRPPSSIQLGAVQLFQADTLLWVANCIAQHGYRRPANLTPLKYDAFEQCCTKLVEAFKSRRASFHMPKVGTGLGGANWHTVERIIERTLVAAGLSVTVYEL